MEKERVKADFINFDYGLVIPDWYIFRVQSGAHRYYGLSLNEEMSEPVYAPGVTSILHDSMPTPYGLTKWREQNGEFYCNWFMESAAMYGTWLHNIYGRLMRGELICFAKEALVAEFSLFCQKEDGDWKSILRWLKAEGRNPQKDIYGFIEWYKKHEVAPIAIEYPIFVEDPRFSFAGTIDLVCDMTVMRVPEGKKKKELERIRAIVDFKTGYNSYESHSVQLAAYIEGWNRMNAKCPIDEGYNLLSKDYNLPLGKTALPYSFRRQTDAKPAALWPLYLEMFHTKHPNIILPKLTFTDEMVSIKSENMIKGDSDDMSSVQDDVQADIEQ